MHDEEKQLARVAAILRASPKDVALKTEQTAARVKELERELADLTKKAAAAKSSELASGIREVNGVKVIASRQDNGDPENLRELADKLRDQMKSGTVVLGGEKDGKATLLVAVTPGLDKQYKAAAQGQERPNT